MSFQSSVSASTYANIIEHSWKRCHEIGMKPEQQADDQMISGALLKELKDQHHFLLAQAEIAFQKFAPFLHHAGCVLIVTNREGTILFASGDTDFASRAAQVQLQVGANWHESRKGTNAIGVALHEQVANLVRGDEHFYIENRFLTCASAPLYSPQGELLGVVNISGHKDRFPPTYAIFAQMAADLLQNSLLMNQLQKEQLITLRQLDIVSAHHPQPLLTLDTDRRITGANQAAIRMLGNCLGQEFAPDGTYQVIPLTDDDNRLYRSVAIKKAQMVSIPPSSSSDVTYRFSDIIGSCPTLLRAKEIARKAAYSSLPVFISGESGTGKELFAQAIHAESGRGPFVAVNCSAIPDTLIESELFGYEKGAFTGANREGSKGKFMAAHGGTLFLDEIGDMSLRAQAALLRVLQEKTVTPVGGITPRKVDVRIIAATHRNLLQEIEAGRFRADLYYRLKGIIIHLPALRERSDLPQLAEHLLLRHADHEVGLSEEALAVLKRYAWPGNIRELLSVLLQASFLAEGDRIRPEHLVLDHPFSRQEEQGYSLRESERTAILEVLKETQGNISKTAKLLNIGRNTLYRKIKGYGIELR